MSNAGMLGMIEASRSVVADLNVKPGQLFLNGWSQGALDTITQELETLAIPVTAATVAAPMNNWLGSCQWSYPLELLKQESASGQPGVDPEKPAPWQPLATGLAIASYGHWHDLDGLLDAMDKIIPDRQFDANGNTIDGRSSNTYADNSRASAIETASAISRQTTTQLIGSKSQTKHGRSASPQHNPSCRVNRLSTPGRPFQVSPSTRCWSTAFSKHPRTT